VRQLAFAYLGLSAALAGGCFYVDPINQRPSLDIRPRERPGTDGFIHRNDKDVILDAVANDPDGQVVTFEWLVYACENGLDFSTCDPEAISTSTQPFAQFDVPAFRADPDGVGPLPAPPTLSLLAILNGRDELGAAAKPPQQLAIAVRDALPDVTMSDLKPYDGVVATPVLIFAEYGDADDSAAGVTLTWQAFSPTTGDHPLEPLTDVMQPDDPERRQAGMKLLTNAEGEWKVKITATDSVGEASVTEHSFLAIGDEPPCIAEVAPEVPPVGAVLPVTEPVLFQALRVRDALDRFPAIVGDEFIGQTGFAWSLKINNGPRELLGAAGSSIAFDPAGFALGDRVEVRLEVTDRVVRATCPDGDAECSLTGGGCFQRQTWNVEVR
jgi:hypothetical protein